MHDDVVVEGDDVEVVVGGIANELSDGRRSFDGRRAH